ncbi:MAG: hypothetical protein AAB442_00395 [Patescibacteria group bacterium]
MAPLHLMGGRVVRITRFSTLASALERAYGTKMVRPKPPSRAWNRLLPPPPASRRAPPRADPTPALLWASLWKWYEGEVGYDGTLAYLEVRELLTEETVRAALKAEGYDPAGVSETFAYLTSEQPRCERSVFILGAVFHDESLNEYRLQIDADGTPHFPECPGGVVSVPAGCCVIGVKKQPAYPV